MTRYTSQKRIKGLPDYHIHIDAPSDDQSSAHIESINLWAVRGDDQNVIIAQGNPVTENERMQALGIIRNFLPAKVPTVQVGILGNN